MSWWTHIKGAIEVEAMGRTQAECRYILDTVLAHLPRVTGSEGDMNVYIAQRAGHNCSSSCDELSMRTNNLTDFDGFKSREYGWMTMQTKYMLTIDADLRDRRLEETKREFLNWLCRLSKRLLVWSVVVKIDDEEKSMVISDETPFVAMYEIGDDVITWTDYLMWEVDPRSGLPLKLAAKYFDASYIRDELNRRKEWEEAVADESDHQA